MAALLGAGMVITSFAVSAASGAAMGAVHGSAHTHPTNTNLVKTCALTTFVAFPLALFVGAKCREMANVWSPKVAKAVRLPGLKLRGLNHVTFFSSYAACALNEGTNWAQLKDDPEKFARSFANTTVIDPALLVKEEAEAFAVHIGLIPTGG
ncbi:hypothetical protein COB21_00020 [Candidatus Aerophobetes bacterium]|uniref:Uncharacterized protein n=1 Tax=Aerophobetes bacterium TaxID=2030807 RepID=A0A2A4X840_UNCAE|nr:MAG: hypothetical protein COB21_00020 [Candidatus Aerophobetes bacterium]